MNKKKLLVFGLVSILTLSVGCSSGKKADDVTAKEGIKQEQEDVKVEGKEEATNKDLIVGEWNSEDGTVTFTEDGIMKQESSVDGVREAEIEVGEGVTVEGLNENGTIDVEVKGEVNFEMEYEVVDENTINFMIFEQVVEYDYELKDNVLTIEDFGEFTRAE